MDIFFCNLKIDGQVTTAFTISSSATETNHNSQEQPLVPPTTETEHQVQPSQKQPLVSNNVSPEKSSTATTTNNGSASHQSHMSDISRVHILSKHYFFLIQLNLEQISGGNPSKRASTKNTGTPIEPRTTKPAFATGETRNP